METPLGITGKVDVQVSKSVPKLVEQTKITRKLLAPSITKKLVSRIITVDGKVTDVNGDGELVLPNKAPKIKVVDTYEDKTTKTWERDFELSSRLIANDINLR